MANPIIYPIPRPKILTAITIPSGGWAVRIQFSVTTQYDTNINFTMAAGTYYMAWDLQADDFMYEFNSKLEAAIKAEATMGGGAGFWVGWECIAYLNTSNQVVIAFDGDNYDATAAAPGARRDVKIQWTVNDGASVAAVLGFDSTADLALTGTNNPTTTADWQHAYGWYANEDGLLRFLGIENEQKALAAQSIAPSGQMITHRYGSHDTNLLGLSFVDRQHMWSQGVGYTTAPVYPYARNVPLECWWREARDGTRFRVYRDGQINTSRAVDGGTLTSAAGNLLSVTDTGKSWDATEDDPPVADRWVGRLFYQAAVTTSNLTIPVRTYIASNSDQALVFSVAQIGDDGSPFDYNSTGAYQVFEQTFDTYILDISQMETFAPREIPNIDRFDIDIPLRKYVA